MITTEHGYKKPLQSEFYNVDIVNKNTDISEEHLADTNNPHGVTKEQVGLNNVPNVTTNDQTPTYSQASSVINITSGEKLSISFGKIKAAIAAIISHLADMGNPHGVTKEQVGLNNVPNVTTNDQTPTYTQASGLANIVSGETVTTVFGKLAKAIATLISHLADTNNPHGATKSQVGLGNVPNVTTNNQTPTFSEASELTTLTSGEVISTSFGKIAKAISTLITHISTVATTSVQGHVKITEGNGLNNDSGTVSVSKASDTSYGTTKLSDDYVNGTGAAATGEGASIKAVHEAYTEINKNFGTLKFGIDADGNAGYIKAGADSVTPFSNIEIVANSEYHSTSGTGQNMSYTIPRDGTLVYNGSYCVDSLDCEKLNGVQIPLNTNVKILSNNIRVGSEIPVKKGDIFTISYSSSKSTMHLINAYVI